jgi:hypothetical protein
MVNLTMTCIGVLVFCWRELYRRGRGEEEGLRRGGTVKKCLAGSKCRRQVPEIVLRNVSNTWRLNIRFLTAVPWPLRFGRALISHNAKAVF